MVVSQERRSVIMVVICNKSGLSRQVVSLESRQVISDDSGL